MKTQIQNSLHTDGVTLPRRRATAKLFLFIVLTLLGLVATPRLEASLSDENAKEFIRFLAVANNDPFATNNGATNTIKNFDGAKSLGRATLAGGLHSTPPPPILKSAGTVHAAISSDVDTLYGTASVGGSAGYGTVFAVQSDGTGFTVLHNFSGGSDGSGPAAGLVLYGTNLIGTTINGGSTDNGVVYAVATNGAGFTVLHNFTARNYPYTNSDGGNPYSQLILSGDTLYGTAADGGSANSGTVFALNVTSTNFTTLHSFAATAYDPDYNLTNSDGATPYADLILSGDTLYGTASGGGINGAGTVFAVKTNGTGFTVLHSFAPINFYTLTNSDGISPYAGLILSGDTLYGTAFRGGSANSGTVFAVKTNGLDFTNLYNFTGGSDGFGPAGDLVLFSNALFGTSSGNGEGEVGGNGTVFVLNTDGSDFTVIHSFSALSYDPDIDDITGTNSDGATPRAGLIAVGSTLYGTAENGGTGANGTVFSISFLPGPTILNASLSETNLVLNCANGLSGETNVALMGTNLTLPLNQWTPVATNVLNADGNFTITATNAVDAKAPQRFYILQSQ
ncbi:MAG TPA: choice-of-anchor tandem repeat GloVer-containing protein [Verrucomicrobiae bacterium]|nr:choice-of-anchor tandem repeat GloVer-containing protein [Verrucomicrobiae bacterium]